MTVETTYIWITTSFEGYHRWDNAPEKYAYLRTWHRHIFHVEIGKRVTHDNRDIEFISFKEKVHSNLERFTGWGNRFPYSCEQIAHILGEHFDAAWVKVSEDAENGALITREPIPGGVV